MGIERVTPGCVVVHVGYLMQRRLVTLRTQALRHEAVVLGVFLDRAAGEDHWHPPGWERATVHVGYEPDNRRS